MKQHWFEIDCVKLLNLEHAFTNEEVREIVEQMDKEVWYRILNEELPNHISTQDFKNISKRFSHYKGLDRIIEYIRAHFASVFDIDSMIKKVVVEVKKEFVNEYLDEVIKDINAPEEMKKIYINYKKYSKGMKSILNYLRKQSAQFAIE